MSFLFFSLFTTTIVMITTNSKGLQSCNVAHIWKMGVEMMTLSNNTPPFHHTHNHNQQNRKGELTASEQTESTPPGQDANSHRRCEHQHRALHKQQSGRLEGEEELRRAARRAEYKTWEEGDACTIPCLFHIRDRAACLGWEELYCYCHCHNSISSFWKHYHYHHY